MAVQQLSSILDMRRALCQRIKRRVTDKTVILGTDWSVL